MRPPTLRDANCPGCGATVQRSHHCHARRATRMPDDFRAQLARELATPRPPDPARAQTIADTLPLEGLTP